MSRFLDDGALCGAKVVTLAAARVVLPMFEIIGR